MCRWAGYREPPSFTVVLARQAEAKLAREQAALLRDQRRQARGDAQAARRAGQPTVGELLGLRKKPGR